jgi:hypothetical protein
VFRFGVGGPENGIVNLINRLPRDRWRHAIVSLTDISREFTERIARPDVEYIALASVQVTWCATIRDCCACSRR